MPDVTASRTLVKSAPELWTECSDGDSLGRHLDPFGDIRITRLEPETAVAWEGELASGTVRLEPSGWGTRVVLTASPAPSPEGAAAVAQPPEAGALVVRAPAPALFEVGDEPMAPPGFFARLFGRFRGQPAPHRAEPEPVAGPVQSPEGPDDEHPPDPQTVLLAALDSLGQAHHRPYSRS
jgi:hypothetical protein